MRADDVVIDHLLVDDFYRLFAVTALYWTLWQGSLLNLTLFLGFYVKKYFSASALSVIFERNITKDVNYLAVVVFIYFL